MTPYRDFCSGCKQYLNVGCKTSMIIIGDNHGGFTANVQAMFAATAKSRYGVTDVNGPILTSSAAGRGAKVMGTKVEGC